MDDTIATSAEAVENAVLPRLREVHVDAACTGACEDDLPPSMLSNATKSAARWAYERLILYIRNFEARLNNDEEIAIGFTGSETGVIRIEGIGYFDPDIVTFYGTDEEGSRTQLIQHVTQLNVMLRALPRPRAQAAPQRIGFRLASELDSSTRA